MQYEVISKGWIIKPNLQPRLALFLGKGNKASVVLINLEAIPANFSAKIDRGTQRSLD